MDIIGLCVKTKFLLTDPKHQEDQTVMLSLTLLQEGEVAPGEIAEGTDDVIILAALPDSEEPMFINVSVDMSASNADVLCITQITSEVVHQGLLIN